MAYVSQALKRSLAPGVKAVLKKYNMKGTLSVRNNMVLVCKLKSGPLDIIGNYAASSRTGFYNNEIPDHMSVNEHWIKENFSGAVAEFLTDLKEAMMVGNHDNSDIQTDYFDVGWYIEIKVGEWNKPYILEN